MYTHPAHYPDPHHRTPVRNRLLSLAFCFFISDWNLSRHSQIPHMYLPDCFWMRAMTHSLSWVSPPTLSVIASHSTLSNPSVHWDFDTLPLDPPALPCLLHSLACSWSKDRELLRLTAKWLGPQRHLLSGQSSTLTTLSQAITGLLGFSSLHCSCIPSCCQSLLQLLLCLSFSGEKNQSTG